MKKGLSSLVVFLFILADLTFFNLSVFISYGSWNFPLEDADLSNRVYLLIFSNIAWFFLLLISNPYQISRKTQFDLIFRSLFSLALVQFLTILSLIFFFDKYYSTGQVFLLYLIYVPVSFFWRLLFFYSIRKIRYQPVDSIPYIIAGQGEQAQDIRSNFRFHPEYGYKFLGMFTGWTVNEETFCLNNRVEEIYCCLPGLGEVELKRMVDFSLNNFIKVKLVTDNREYYQKGIQLGGIGEIPVINAAAIPLDETINQVLKRIFDLVFTIIVLVTILSWLMPLIMLLIKLDSKGPAIYKQLRAGKSNKPFMCLKFRTMTHQPEGEFVQAKRNDPRVTAVGKFLRKTSLDEFPQFINVLKGEMSVVGPRPHPIKLNDDFAEKIRKLHSRHYVKPGVTGLAQCLGYRGETIDVLSMKHRITLDRFYVEHWSLLFDIQIIYKTAGSLLSKSGMAY